MKAKRLKPKNNSNEMIIRKAKWKRLRDIFGFTPPLDGMISALSGKISLNLFRLEQMIPNYNGNACTYKGKPNYSMKMAIKEEYGREAMELVNDLIH